MDEKGLQELVQRTSDTLEELDIHIWDVNVYVYDMGGIIYRDYNTLAGAVERGDATAFIEVDAILGEKVWELIEARDS